MESDDKSRRKCFTFLWKLENARYCWQKKRECIASPAFVVDEIEESMWRLVLFPRCGDKENHVGLHLFIDSKTNNVEIDSEIAFLALDGTVLQSVSCTKRIFSKESKTGPFCCAKREYVFPAIRSSFYPRDTFKARCKIWKSVGEISQNVQCIARTRIGVEKRSFIWNIENFSALERGKSYALKSLKNKKKLMSLRLFLNRDKKIHFVVAAEDQRIKYSTFHFSVVDASRNTIEGLREDIWHDVPHQSEQLTLFFSKKKLMEKKNIYLPNDVLSLRCKCAMSFGIVLEEIEGICSDCTGFENDELDNHCSDKEHTLPVSKNVLNESFKSLLEQKNGLSLFTSVMIDSLQSSVNDGSLSDIKLRTSSQTYPAHKFILSARSPVFKAMFSSENKQKINDFVDIVDLDDDTVSQILRYIYRSEVKQLEWSIATKLYIGADKYQILNLKNICSSFLKTNLSLTNACEALVLADLRQDEDLKGFVQDFILKYAKCIMNSEEWKNLMKNNITLAAETMHLKFRK